MVIRELTLIGAATFLLTSSAAFAQQTNSSSGVTSGPAAGGNVQPGAALNSDEGRSSSYEKSPDAAAGAPGVKAKPGTESGAKPSGTKNANQ